jgi:hypothetical protein
MKKIIASALLFSAVATAPALAADTPFYIGAQVGDATSVLGGYQFDKMFSAELMYSNYNSYASSFGVSAVALLPLNLNGAPGLSAFGKVGVIRTTVEVTVPTFCGFAICNTTYSNSSTDIGFGVGAQYDFNASVSGRLGVDFGEYKTSDLYIGAIFKF